MFLAYASSLRSGQLGRQVGAAITTKTGDLLAVGCNDVPKPGGGLYWPGPNDNRDHILGFDTNDKQRNKIIDQLIAKVKEVSGVESPRSLRRGFWSVLDISEFGRAVHAEMDALLTCARSGVSPTGGILYTTTFPCHNCTRHIVAVGIERVIYIEPYAKSRAEELHDDAIVVEEKALRPNRGSKWKVPFTHFVGIGPRKYFDLFSLNLSSGHELNRKDGGQKLEIKAGQSWPRIPLSAFTYIERERLAMANLDLLPKQLDIFSVEE
jgi:deoxycytidylate deaminase